MHIIMFNLVIYILFPVLKPKGHHQSNLKWKLPFQQEVCLLI